MDYINSLMGGIFAILTCKFNIDGYLIIRMGIPLVFIFLLLKIKNPFRISSHILLGYVISFIIVDKALNFIENIF